MTSFCCQPSYLLSVRQESVPAEKLSTPRLQIFAPYSPHNFVDSFPNISPGDCPERPAAGEVQVGCVGDADQYGNYRAPRIVSLKHHWFWLMNHVWDEMPEMRDFEGHIMFMEEDHVLAPNASTLR